MIRIINNLNIAQPHLQPPEPAPLRRSSRRSSQKKMKLDFAENMPEDDSDDDRDFSSASENDEEQFVIPEGHESSDSD